MSITKTESGWKVDVRPNGSGKRYRKTLKTKAEAIRWQAWLVQERAKNPDWEPPKADKRRLADLVDEWFLLHGQHLKDGAKRVSKLRKICDELNNPKADDVSADMYLQWRAEKAKTFKANTLNHDLAYLKAVFNELIRQSLYKKNPLENIKPIKIDENPLSYLTSDEIVTLINELKRCRNKDALVISKVCLATGARWTEAESLTKEQVRSNAISFHRTKSGKNRTIPISKGLFEELSARPSMKLFKSSYKAFSNALEKSGIVTPEGQRTHILRHTFASHFVMKGGNLLTLQKILGHQSIVMTMRYAHLAPEHLNEAVKYNPIDSLDA